MKKCLFLFVLIFFQHHAFPQFYQAVYGSNLAGSLGIHNNPASALTHPKPWDLTIIGFQIKNATNLLYLERYALKGQDKQLLMFLKNGDFKKRFNNELNTNLLNAHLRLNNRLAFSFGANLRSATNGHSSSFNFQDSLSNFNSFLLINDKNQPLQASVVNSSWFELYGSLAYNLLESKHFIWNAGITMKANKGIFASTLTLDNARFNQILSNPPVYQLNDIQLKYFYAGEIDRWDQNRSNAWNTLNYFTNAEGGHSFDIGMEWIIKDLRNLELFESTTQYDYKWKLGISLLDLGFAQYKHGLYSGNANGLKYSISVPALLKKFDSTIIDLSTFNDSARTIANQFTNYYTTFNIQHPTRMVFNVDHPITDVISINAELSLPVSLPSAKTDFTLKTLAYATITPRMEEERYGLFLPLSINANGYFWMGAAFKAGPFLLGMHNILPFFQKTPYLNGGGYLAYVISPSEKLKRIKSKDVKCPD